MTANKILLTRYATRDRLSDVTRLHEVTYTSCFWPLNTSVAHLSPFLQTNASLSVCTDLVTRETNSVLSLCRLFTSCAFNAASFWSSYPRTLSLDSFKCGLKTITYLLPLSTNDRHQLQSPLVHILHTFIARVPLHRQLPGNVTSRFLARMKFYQTQPEHK